MYKTFFFMGDKTFPIARALLGYYKPLKKKQANRITFLDGEFHAHGRLSRGEYYFAPNSLLRIQHEGKNNLIAAFFEEIDGKIYLRSNNSISTRFNINI